MHSIQSPYIGPNPEGSLTEFRISGQITCVYMYISFVINESDYQSIKIK